jgi:hypothetical protein
VTEVRIRDRGRGSIRATLVASDDVHDQGALAARAVDALYAVGDGLFEPLAVGVEIVCCDAEFGYPLGDPRPDERFHQLRLASVPDEVLIPDIWAEPRVGRRERLDSAAIVDWVGVLLAEQVCAEPDTMTGWAGLIVEAVRARLPEAISNSVTSTGLPVFHRDGGFDYPVERFADTFWVAGPLVTAYDTAPFEVSILNEAGALTLDWSQNWSPWIEEDGAGRPDVEAAVRRLSAKGWDVEPASP